MIIRDITPEISKKLVYLAMTGDNSYITSEEQKNRFPFVTDYSNNQREIRRTSWSLRSSNDSHYLDSSDKRIFISDDRNLIFTIWRDSPVYLSLPVPLRYFLNDAVAPDWKIPHVLEIAAQALWTPTHRETTIFNWHHEKRLFRIKSHGNPKTIGRPYLSRFLEPEIYYDPESKNFLNIIHPGTLLFCQFLDDPMQRYTFCLKVANDQ